MLSKWPAPGGADSIPVFIQSMVDQFVKTSNSQQNYKLSSDDIEIKDIDGEYFDGKIAVFEIKIEGSEPMVQTMYMVSDGKEIWNGQFTGPKSLLNESIDIIKTISRKR